MASASISNVTSIQALLNGVGMAGGGRNIELTNSMLALQISVSFISSLESMQLDLLTKMNGDREKAEALKNKLSAIQDVSNKLTDPTSDSKTHQFVLASEVLENPPFDKMVLVDRSYWNTLTSAQQSSFIATMKVDFPEFKGAQPTSDNNDFNWFIQTIEKRGLVVYYLPDDKLSGKSISAFYTQQQDSIKAAITSVNTLTSQDNLTLQSLRSKIESVTQFLSSLIKASTDLIESVIRKLSN